jgi:H+/Cl- antiporter ClcA
MKSTALMAIAVGLIFAIASVLCLFAQQRVLHWLLRGNLRQLDFAQSNPWCYAVLGVLMATLGFWGMAKRASFSGPAWVPVVMVLVGLSLILGHRFIAQFQHDTYYHFYVQGRGANASWKPSVRWYTYAAGIILALASFISVSAGVYNLRH